MRLPPRLVAMLQAVRSAGRPRLVGGCVRDWLLGLEPKDFDVEVFGCSYESLARTLAPFGRVDFVGRAFGVLKIRGDGWEFDFSLPRRDSKTGERHQDFAVAPDPNLSEYEAALRRDFTLNALSWDPFADTVIDPLGGRADLDARVLRHTGPHFREDPLRVLRGFQFAARFDFTAAAETLAECRSLADSYDTLPVERVWMEWEKWARQATRPSAGLRFLKDSGWLRHFPELAALDGCPQDPEWHPEGDVFVHTGHCCDAMVRQPGWLEAGPERRRDLLLAILCHDLGKPSTTHQAEKGGRLRWISPGHEPAGGPLAEAFLRRINAPHAVATVVRPLVENHLWPYSAPVPPAETTVRRLARRLAPATIGDLCLVLMSDHLGRPPLVKEETALRIEHLREAARALALADAAPKPLLLGRHLIEAGLRPGPEFRGLLDRAFEAQLDGAFRDEAGAREFLKSLLAERPSSRQS